MKIYAHRGFSYIYPEASRAAYEAAIQAGADGLECDIRLTRDGVPICFHDRDTTRIAGVKRVISKSDFAELKALVDPLTLDELLEMAQTHQRELLIETKHPVRTGGRVEAAVLQRIAQAKLHSRIILISFSLIATLRLRRRHSEVGYVISRKWRAFFIPTKIVAVDIELFRRSRLLRRNLRGREIFLWTVNEPKDIPNLIQWQVSGVITDRPDLGFKD